MDCRFFSQLNNATVNLGQIRLLCVTALFQVMVRLFKSFVALVNVFQLSEFILMLMLDLLQEILEALELVLLPHNALLLFLEAFKFTFCCFNCRFFLFYLSDDYGLLLVICFLLFLKLLQII